MGYDRMDLLEERDRLREELAASRALVEQMREALREMRAAKELLGSELAGMLDAPTAFHDAYDILAAALAAVPDRNEDAPVERGAANEPWNCTRPGGCRSPLACSARAEVEPGYCLATAQAKLAAAGGAEGDAGR